MPGPQHELHLVAVTAPQFLDSREHQLVRVRQRQWLSLNLRIQVQ